MNSLQNQKPNQEICPKKNYYDKNRISDISWAIYNNDISWLSNLIHHETSKVLFDDNKVKICYKTNSQTAQKHGEYDGWAQRNIFVDEFKNLDIEIYNTIRAIKPVNINIISMRLALLLLLLAFIAIEAVLLLPPSYAAPILISAFLFLGTMSYLSYLSVKNEITLNDSAKEYYENHKSMLSSSI